jgi:hypothetical protein
MPDRHCRIASIITAMSLACATAARAEDLARMDPAQAPAAHLSVPSPTVPSQGLYQLCTFYPKPGTCEAVYQRALHDTSVTAEAVKAEYDGYARYLHGGTGLTDADRRFLQANGIRLPAGLSPRDQIGLHNALNRPGLDGRARNAAANNFLSRAVEAQLYCGLNACGESTATAANEMG